MCLLERESRENKVPRHQYGAGDLLWIVLVEELIN